MLVRSFFDIPTNIFLWRCDPTRVTAFSFLRFLDRTQRRSTVGRTPLDECSALRRDLYLTTHNTHNRQRSMPPVGFEPHDISRRAAADLRQRPHDHWHRFNIPTNAHNIYTLKSTKIHIKTLNTCRYMFRSLFKTILRGLGDCTVPSY